MTARGKIFGALPEQRILVTGAPRSATTFVGKVLSWPVSVDYLHEPLNPLCGIPSVATSYLDLGGLQGLQRQQLFGEVDALLRYEPMLRTGHYTRDPLVRRLVKPLVGSRGPVYLRLARLNPTSRSVVVKDPFAAMTVETLIDEWGFRPIALVRHPVAFAASMERLGWEPSLMLADIAAQPAVVERLAAEDAEQLGRPVVAEWEAAALLWRITVREFLRVAARHASVVLLTHEAVSNRPVEVFHQLYEDLGLPWNEVVERRIRRATSGSDAEAAHGRTQSFTRDSASLLALRLDQLDDDVRRQIWDLTGEVASRWYEPDGVLPSAAAGVLPPGGGSPSAERPPVPDVAVGRRVRPRVQVAGLASPTGSLVDQMVADSCHRWLAHVLAADGAGGGDRRSEVTVVAGGLVGPPGPAGERGWSPSVDPRRPRQVLMGVGWTSGSRPWPAPVARLARWGLTRHYLHAVRDEATRARLLEVGLHNVVVTGCPTTWDVDPDAVPSAPAARALVALRHDLDDEHVVSSLVALLDERYDEVLLLPLHPRDRHFLPLLPRRWEVLPSRLAVLDELLADGGVDCVSTSVHTGVRALAAGARALVVDGDPHLGSVAGPLGLPTFDRRDLSALRAAVEGPLPVRLHRPDEAVDEWLGQFLWAGEARRPVAG